MRTMPSKSMIRTLFIAVVGFCHLLAGTCLAQQSAILPTIHFSSPTENETVRWSISSNALGECSIVIFKPVKKVYELELDQKFAAELGKIFAKNEFFNLKSYYGTPVPGGQEFSISWCLQGDRHLVTLANIFRLKKKNMPPGTLEDIKSIRDLLMLYQGQILKSEIKSLDGVATELHGMANEIIRPEDE